MKCTAQISRDGRLQEPGPPSYKSEYPTPLKTAGFPDRRPLHLLHFPTTPDLVYSPYAYDLHSGTCHLPRYLTLPTGVGILWGSTNSRINTCVIGRFAFVRQASISVRVRRGREEVVSENLHRDALG